MTVASNKTANSSSSNADRTLSLKCRPDLETSAQTYLGRNYWVVKDPIALKYFRFEEEEFAILKMIDGVASPEQIKRTFDFQFAPQKISLQELYQFVGMLFRSSLLVSDAPNQGVQLHRRGQQTRSREARQSLTNILAIRYRGFDPDRLLGWLNGWVGWFFSWPAFWCVALLGMAALSLVIAQFEVFQNRLPSFENFFAASNWIWLALAMAGAKVLHELGHGLACKRFGGQCHEMGLMLLVLTPCLYVNVSDSWLLNDKWKRALIAAAGMYVELVLASVAVFVWWFSQPGLINQLALNLVFVSSVSTLLFNANPLLRYDGYYILSDVLEIPNLRTKATTILQRMSGKWLLGIEPRHDPFLPPRNRVWFAVYSVAAAAYRWLITFSIFWFVYQILEPYGFKIIGQLVACTAIYGLLVSPLIRLVRFFLVPGRIGIVKPARASISAALVVVLFGIVLGLPIPHHVVCSFYVQPADAENVYVDVAGSLAEIYTPGNRTIEEGDPIVRLHSHDLRVQLASLATDLETASVRLTNIRRASATTAELSDGLQSAEVAKQAALTNYQQRLLDEGRLVVRAPISGFLVSPPRIPDASSDRRELPTWHGSPLEPRNLGAHLSQGTLLGQIVPDPDQLEAVLAVDQGDIEFVESGQSVDLVIHQLPGQSHQSTVAVVTPNEMEHMPKSLSNRFGGDIVTVTNRNNQEVPQSTKFLVKVGIHSEGNQLVPGSTGVAKIRTGSQTIGRRLWRLINQTFQFEL